MSELSPLLSPPSPPLPSSTWATDQSLIVGADLVLTSPGIVIIISVISPRLLFNMRLEALLLAEIISAVRDPAGAGPDCGGAGAVLPSLIILSLAVNNQNDTN